MNFTLGAFHGHLPFIWPNGFFTVICSKDLRPQKVRPNQPPGKDHQPHKLSSRCVKGVSQPNHVRIFWSTDAGSVLAQSKHWLTSPEWSPAMVLLEREDVQSLSMLFPPVVEPCWDDSFLTQAQSWFQKLRELLQAGNMQTSGVDQCLAILHHEDEDFLPSKQSVGDRIVKIRRAAEQQQRNAGVNGGLGFSEELRKAMSAAFPGSSAQNRPGSTGLIRVVGARAAAADSGFCNDELETGMLVIFECGKNRLLPCRVGRILRIMREHSRESTAIIEVWRDIAKPGKYERPNLFGTWSPPTKVAEVSAAKRRRGCALQHVITIPLGKVLVWPLTLEAKEGQDASDESGKIPLAAMHFHAFSARGWSHGFIWQGIHIQQARSRFLQPSCQARSKFHSRRRINLREAVPRCRFQVHRGSHLMPIYQASASCLRLASPWGMTS